MLAHSGPQCSAEIRVNLRSVDKDCLNQNIGYNFQNHMFHFEMLTTFQPNRLVVPK